MTTVTLVLRSRSECELDLTPLNRPVLGLPIPLELSRVQSCLLLESKPYDRLFAQALTEGLPSLPPRQRVGGLAGATGNIAESIVELLLSEIGYHPVSHLVEPGQHGIDLLMFEPESTQLLVVEVKGSLSTRRWPRLTRGEVLQMSPEWIDKVVGLAVADTVLVSDDLVGAFVAVSFARMCYRISGSEDFVRWRALDALDAVSEMRRR